MIHKKYRFMSCMSNVIEGTPSNSLLPIMSMTQATRALVSMFRGASFGVSARLAGCRGNPPLAFAQSGLSFKLQGFAPESH